MRRQLNNLIFQQGRLRCRFIAMLILKAAQQLIHKGTTITEGLLNRVEVAFRAYDPCFACATHSLPGQMPLEVTLRDVQGYVLQILPRLD